MTPEDKLPPQNLEAEASVLGSLLHDNALIDVVAVILQPEDFYASKHGKIYKAILALRQNRQGIDVVTLKDELDKHHHLIEVGGFDYLFELAGCVPSAANGERYAEIVKDKSVRRKLLNVGYDIIREAQENPSTSHELVGIAQEKVFAIVKGERSHKILSLQDLGKEVWAIIEGRVARGAPTGFFNLDEIIGGLERGSMSVIAGRPSMGKSALLLNILTYHAKKGTATGLFNLEEGANQIMLRLLAAETPYALNRLHNVQSEEGKKNIMEASIKVEQWPFLICESPSLRLPELRLLAWQMVHLGAQMLAFDYIQLIRAPGATSETHEVTLVSHALKSLALELNVPVIAVSQLSREADKREDHRPLLSDLRQSGSIEQDAGIVMFVYREERYNQKNPELKHKAEIIVSKHRNGPCGTAKFHFDGATMTFKPMVEARKEHERWIPTE